MPSLYDKVILSKSVDGLSVKVGSIASIVDIYEVPREAYEIEFFDEYGKTLALMAIDPDNLEFL